MSISSLWPCMCASAALLERPIRRIYQGRYGVSVPALTKDHKGIKLNTSYPKDQYVVLEIWNEYNILEDIKRGSYSKKSPIRRIQSLDTPFYPESYDGEDEMLDEGENWGIDPLEFLSNFNTSFKNLKKVYGRTQKESIYENPSNTATDSFFKTYEVSDIEKQSQTKHKYSNTSNSIKELPNKRRCKAEKFEAIQYSLGPNEEYIAIRSYEYDIWERNKDNMSKIYQDIFQKKDEGWKDIQDSPDDEEDTGSSHEYLNDLEEEYQARALLAKSKRFFKKELRPTKDFKAKYNKVKAKSALLSSSAPTFKTLTVKNKGLIAEAYEWDEEEVSSDDNEMVEVKVLMALAEDNDAVSKEGARNGEWVKVSIRKPLVLKQEKLDFLTMHHVNTQILKENKNLRTELKELKAITETWLNSSNKVNQCISEQIPSQKKRILGVDQLTEGPSSSRQKDLVFVKSSANDTKVTIPGVERPWLSEAEGFILPNHDTGRILPAESQRNTTDPSVAVTDSSVTDYDSTDESSVCSTSLPPLKKLDGVEPISGPKTIKSILRSKSTFKAEALKGVIINKPSSAPSKGNKSSSASKVYSAPAGKLKSVKIEEDPPLAIVMKELNNLKLQFSKN
ncbi:hypothetical protein Tco_0431441 [Tanacetum coccineum]